MGGIYGPSYFAARKERLAFCEGACELCKHDGSQHRLEAHHAGEADCYERDRRDELRMQDLLVLCERCHNWVTDRERRERFAAAMPIRPVATIESPMLHPMPPTPERPIVVPPRLPAAAIEKLPPTR